MPTLVTVTADTYTSVLPDLARTAAEKAAAIVPRHPVTTLGPPRPAS